MISQKGKSQLKIYLKNNMKKYSFFLFIVVATSSFCFSQNNPISNLRYNDDFSYLKTDTVKKGLNSLKYIKLSKTATISFGGEIREQFQYFDNLNFGDIPPTSKETSVGQLWHRIMAHSNLEIGSNFRAFVQLNSTLRFFNPDPIAPEIDENQLSLHQAFIEYHFDKNWKIRAGRQEIGYGSNRVITFREGPNTRLTFDAAIVKYHSSKRNIDFLAITPVISNQYVFDDTSFKTFVYGVYGTEFVIDKKLLIDYYVLHFSSDTRRYNYVAGSEERQSFGFRIFSQNKKFNYELESSYQIGTFNNQKIGAYNISSDINYKIHGSSQCVVGAVFNYISGDQDRNDNRLNTFNQFFAKPSFGLAAPIGSTNIVNLNPYLRIAPIKKLSIYAGVYLMQRQSTEDGTYTPGSGQIRPNRNALFNTDKRVIGTQYALETGYQLNNHLFFAIDSAYFVAGDYVKATGNGLDITYLAFKTAFKF